jgi:predicted nucleic acid-binding protein
MTSKFVFDNYALMEIIGGNDNYEPYLDSEIVINNFIFAELCYVLNRDKYPKIKENINKYAKHISSVNPDWIQEAMQFRLKWKDRGVSITDCISYIMAKKLGIKFLTGDKEFENMENVEFVK